VVAVAEIGRNKAQTLAGRVNAALGLKAVAVPQMATSDLLMEIAGRYAQQCRVLLGAVATTGARRMLHEAHVAVTPGMDFDPLQGKRYVRLCYAGSRSDMQEAIARMRRTLEMTVVEGIKTTVPLHLRILADADSDGAHIATLLCALFVRHFRSLVQDGVYDAFAEKLKAAVGKLKVGNGLEEGVTQGPLINADAVAKVEEHIGDAEQRGARLGRAQDDGAAAEEAGGDGRLQGARVGVERHPGGDVGGHHPVLGDRHQQEVEEVALVVGRLLARQQQVEVGGERQPAHQVAAEIAAAQILPLVPRFRVPAAAATTP